MIASNASHLFTDRHLPFYFYFFGLHLIILHFLNFSFFLSSPVFATASPSTLSSDTYSMFLSICDNIDENFRSFSRKLDSIINIEFISMSNIKNLSNMSNTQNDQCVVTTILLKIIEFLFSKVIKCKRKSHILEA